MRQQAKAQRAYETYYSDQQTMKLLFELKPDLGCQPKHASLIRPTTAHACQMARKPASHKDSSNERQQPRIGEEFATDTAHFTRNVAPGQTRYSQHFIDLGSGGHFVFPMARLRSSDFIEVITMFINMMRLRFKKTVRTIAADAFSSLLEGHDMLQLLF